MKCRILAVEDSATQAEALRSLLEEQGHDVTVARSAELALEQLETTDFDLVLSDVMMPGITGYELCTRIKQDPNWSKLPVVLLTSLNDPMDIVRGLECGADNYITKPYDTDHLLARVRHVLDNRRLRMGSKTSMGVTVRFLGRDLTITSDREQILDLFISSVEDVVRANEALQRSQRQLAAAHEQLEAYARAKDHEARASTDRYRALLRNAGDAIFVVDSEASILEVNQRGAEMLARSAEEVIGHSLLDVAFPRAPEDRAEPQERQELAALLQNLAGRESTWRGERKFNTPDGNEIWCDITASPSEVDGAALVLLIVRDITSRRAAEEALRQRERQLQEAQQIADIGNFERDFITDEYNWSDQLYRILGRDPGENVGFEEFSQQIHPEDRDLHFAALLASARTGQPFSIDFRIYRLDGTERTVHARGGAELGPNDQLGRISGTLQDVTERKEAERARREREEADQANRAKSEFLSRMSHELRTPLNAILGFGQLLALDDLAADQRESVEQIIRGGRHLLQLINEVLDLARIEAGRLSLSLEPVSVRRIVSDVADLMEPVAEQRRITLAVDLDGAVDTSVLADEQRLKQVLLNFVSNGIKYNQRGGRVTIQVVRAEEDRLRIQVVDNGRGMTPEQVQKLFVAFQRLGAEQDEIEGTGLGLLVTKGLVEAMGGRVGVESQVGQGSNFWLELQESEVSAASRDDADSEFAPASLPPTFSDTRTVLYIEDNASNMRLVERMLRRPDIRLLSSVDGNRGLALAQEHRPDLILLDLNLPGLSGEEVLEQLRADPDLETIPVVIVSADAMPGQRERLLQAGARDYLTKPIEVNRFLEVVFGLLEEGRR